MGGGFLFAAANSAAAPPFPTAGSFPTPAVCTETQPSYFSQNDSFFGPVPSRLEVENAILQLQRFMRGHSTTKSELDGQMMHHDYFKMLQSSTTKSELDGLHGQMMHHDLFNMLQTTKSELDGLCGQMMHHYYLQSPGFIKFSEAFAMMQAEPPIQNLVISISCDAAVWEAISSNKAVKDLNSSISAGKEEKRETYSKEAELAEVILRWIQEFTNSKLFQLLESFASLVHEIFKPTSKDKPTSDLTDLVNEKVQSSLLLSVVILLIVVVTRRHD